ncbi:hypothetical protein [Catenuloplanes japonicus]|nr:hypothetical protein [Catenuloplanes japonicus]
MSVPVRPGPARSRFSRRSLTGPRADDGLAAMPAGDVRAPHVPARW